MTSLRYAYIENYLHKIDRNWFLASTKYDELKGNILIDMPKINKNFVIFNRTHCILLHSWISLQILSGFHAECPILKLLSFVHIDRVDNCATTIGNSTEMRKDSAKPITLPNSNFSVLKMRGKYDKDKKLQKKSRL